MIDMHALMNLQAVMFLEMAAGFIVRKLNLVKGESKGILTALIVYVTLPCNIVKSFMIEMNGEILKQGLIMLVASVVVQLFLALAASVCYNWLPKKRKTVFQYATIASNSGILGNIIAGAIYGNLGYLYSALYVIPQRIVMWSAGVSYFTEAPDRKTVVKKVLSHPCINAVWLGMIVMIFQIQFPEFLNTGIQNIGNMTSPLTMMFLGMSLSESGFKGLITRHTCLYSFIRFVIIPTVVMLGCFLVNMDSVAAGVAVVLAAMPAASMTAVVASQYDGDVTFAANVVVLSTILSILLLPVWVMIVSAVFLL
ncbi:AEC family transporter [Oribacterium sp. P6A1]|uniref:AEC family transporter n=1 Tax=Oribacterium sp. P6A1 TaxID=1410612 RepID=UPI00055BC35B|nr:AEC family transporter [Oribacterium sp. P6A1]